MRILVVSDTHGSPSVLLDAVRQAGSTDMLLHLGDGQRDCAVLEPVYNGQIVRVRGNCDFGPYDDTERLLRLDGATVFMTHGHLYDAKITLNKLWFKGREMGADIVCFGHTHVPLLEKQGEMTLLNPGSLRHVKTYGLVRIVGSSIDVSIHRLGDA